MAKKRMSCVEIGQMLERYRNFRGTSKELSELTGITRKTLQNRSAKGSLFKEYGIVLDNDLDTTKECSSLELKLSAFKVLVNAIHLAHDLPLPYKNMYKETVSFRYHALSSKEVLDYLSAVESSDALQLNSEDYYNLAVCYDTLNFAPIFNANVKKDMVKSIIETFVELHGFEPSVQQIKAVNSVVRYAKGDFGLLHRARIEAIAGSGKSVVCSVATKILETLYGMPEVEILSLSSFVASNNINGKTIARLISDRTKLKASMEELGRLKAALEIRSRSPLHAKTPFVIVDEFSTLPPEYQVVVESFYARVLYVGDSSQIRTSVGDYGPPLCTLSEQYRFVNSKTDLQVTLSRYMFNGQLEEFSEAVEASCSGYFSGKLTYASEGNTIRVTTDYTDALDEILEEEKSKGLYNKLSTIFLGYSKNIVKEINRKLNGGDEIKVGSIVSLKNYVYMSGGKRVSTGTRFKVFGVRDDGKLRLINDNECVDAKRSQVELAFAMTSLRAQGGTWDHVVYFGNTAYQEQQYADTYSSVGRAKITVTVYLRSSIDVQKIKMLNILKPFVKGERNTKLSKDLYTYLSEAGLSGLSSEEIADTVRSVLSSTLDVSIKSKLKKVLKEVENTEPQELKHNPNAYSYVLVSPEGKYIYPRSEQKNKTKEQAQYALDTALKEGYTGFLTFNLKGQPYVVFDFDNDVEAIDKFKHLLDQTKGAINSEGTSMHLWFEVDKFYNTEHFRVDGKGVDVLANTSETNVNQKPNKTYNTLDPMPLSEEILALFKDHIKITYNKESRLCL